LLGPDGEPERRVVSHYNSLHLLTSQQVFTSALGNRTAGELVRGYSWQDGDSPAPPPRDAELPADWALPVREASTVHNSAGQKREVATAAAYDAYGAATEVASSDGRVVFTAPARSGDGHRLTAVL
ncbi:hypothetical protein, partial [Streptomyces sp. NRRL F-2664]|uniref:hypothetical protein n=1 Tax=Streptomyces sp. NRRL F-2664 TaxID=1463842 RepID=UPI0005BDD56D